MCVSNLIFAKISGSKRDRNDRTPQWIYTICALSYVGAMLASNYALKHVNYPTQVIDQSYTIYISYINVELFIQSMSPICYKIIVK